jgi:hypothetical protein
MHKVVAAIYKTQSGHVSGDHECPVSGVKPTKPLGDDGHQSQSGPALGITVPISLLGRANEVIE